MFALDELWSSLKPVEQLRLIVSANAELRWLGGPHDRNRRNHLTVAALARRTAEWLREHSEIMASASHIGQGMIVGKDGGGQPQFGASGTIGLSTDGLGLTPSEYLGHAMVFDDSHHTEQMLAPQFDRFWRKPETDDAKQNVLRQLNALATPRQPEWLYAYILSAVFASWGDKLAEGTVINSRTGIKNSVVWNKLYTFQRDGVTAALDRLQRYGGCIIADSVGLGKTFEALAIIKYHELRNDRVLVLCPKRLRENWTVWTQNDRRNMLADDKLRYDVLNHTDLSRDAGTSGDIDLANIAWGNYDLVVIDESHNFRNKRTPRANHETRYDRLMRQIVAEGVDTKVLMLSATPVNNGLADLKNQIAFATNGDDEALAHEGIPSIESLTRSAQKAFNRWLDEPKERRTQNALINRLGFGYFSLLDKLTIARSRKHIARYYGTEETGTFPDRLPPKNVRAAFDTEREFPSIRSVNDELRQLHLAAYTPLKYVYPHKQQAYDEIYSQQVRGGDSIFRQLDREVSMVALMRMNLLKRLESSVSSFRLTVQRQLAAVNQMLRRLDEHNAEVDELSIHDIDDLDDPLFESLAVGKRVKVLLADVDLRVWRAELEQDRTRLSELLGQSEVITPARDQKLKRLREALLEKASDPLNPGNRKAIVFTAFADTAQYLYDNLAPGFAERHHLNSALVRGDGKNASTLGSLRRKDMTSILTAFSPRSKGRPEELAKEGELEILFATDCISEGQNLQDCDYLVNYDIHWNPVRIIQRFGRVDRLGSINARIQLVNFWPDVELEEYIGLEQRVSGRMKLLNVSATGEEDVTEADSGNVMNDLDYRREQLERMQSAVPDLEDLNGSLSITDLTMGDFRLDLSRFEAEHPAPFEGVLPGAFSEVTTPDAGDVPPGTIFCIRAETPAALKIAPADYPLAPHYLVYVAESGEIVYEYTRIKHMLDSIKRLAHSELLPGAPSIRNVADAKPYRQQLERAVGSLFATGEERAASSLFSAGGTVSARRGVAGVDDFEVIAYLIIHAS